MSRLLLTSLCLLLALSCVWSCASTGPAKKAGQVAVMPLSSLGTTPETSEDLRTKLNTALSDQAGAKVVARDEVDAAVEQVCHGPEDLFECLEKDENLLRLGEQLKVDLVVAGQLAAMGDTHALKLKVAAVPTRAVSAEILTTDAGDQAPFLDGLLDLHDRLSPKEIPKPWYKKWQTWTITGVVVVAAGIVVGSVLLQTESNSPGDLDFDGTLP
jgi:hypothetical protein